ncbi:hypothetical protein A2331_00775 [Candidatus Falkowbacteria bacterium RIFOXYB2_FULL_34_18]|uniref:Adenylate kinase n=1 Tax=Candidatus Falkowbacteria bacterium RIFOXYD2_FULL_34_120 TaxID=1798007 RepID=A0A1F5TM59_9BACT|nr:MAG: hypothetical protein A2331_00775 [Candidatus Falkowbacteria bacterium RIFOXYB2_FULL_34_18]OGF29244.1 MAG: hypothetical protein A2500_06090 [Candidatus Falkowbacteria bacterium RIFOXYC12_FULL_34_55]OGF37778.1 MAG: hypothetical protein A2466_06420 [Candidatus Falkowbacteria bacterium RIFOXYC2_FULL_34_220]OGF38766.1 MAG: hypothetical protein A2515_01755 [Candidatus Falkowbacteria bacterium RIFOXYD12_FULL_34_57]OGF40000.1 MAG: hypothetical protein A2531_02010 [Candidatus Falkowbacteria bact
MYIIFLGAPGSGKGTQADMLGEYLNIPVISPGELLRHEIETKSLLGRSIKKKLSKGQLVANDIVEKIIDKRISKKDTQNGFILDGYPRRLKQASLLKDRLKKITSQNSVLVIDIIIRDKVIKERVTGRRVCDCGATYHLVNNPPKKKDVCDLCGLKLYQRDDDKHNVIADRLKHFHARVRKINKYLEKYYKIVKINGELSIKDTKNEIIKIVKNEIE